MTYECIDTMNAVLGYFHDANARYIYLDYMDDMSDGEPVIRLCCTVSTPTYTTRSITVDVWRDRVWCKAYDENRATLGAAITDHKPMYHGLPLTGKREHDLISYLCIDDKPFNY